MTTRTTSTFPLSAFRSRLSGNRGVALILTLGILVLVTLLVVAFAVSMRVENTASKNFNDLIKARQLAQGAIDQAVATIHSATPPTPQVGTTPTITWAAAPGAIYMIGPSLPSGLVRSNLFTDATVLNSGTVDLNTGYLITGNNSFYNSPANAAIAAGWQNVTVPTAVGNELVGRFAYWVDVEATKVNVSAANLRTASNPTITTDPLINQSLPGDIDLRALEPPFYENPGTLTTIGSFTTARSIPPSQPWFSTVEEMRRGLAPTTPDSGYGGYTSNRFFITVGTVETNTDAFGRDRIDLTQITGNLAPAWSSALASFGDTTWAIVLYPGIVTGARSLRAKYGNFGAAQILANIADYQNPTAAPPTTDGVVDADGIPQNYCGLKKGPMIDEVIFHAATNAVPVAPDQTNVEVRVFVDVKLIDGYEVARGFNYSIRVALQGDPVMTYITNPNRVNAWSPLSTADQNRTFTTDIPAHGFGLLGASSGTAAIGGAYPPPSYMTTLVAAPSGPLPVLQNLTLKLKHVKLLHASVQIVDWMAQMDFDRTLPTGVVFPNPGMAADIVTFATNGVPASPDFANAGGVFRPMALFKQDIRTRTFPGYGVTPAAGALANNAAVNLYTNWFVVGSSGINPVGSQAYSSRISPEVYGLLADLRSIEPVMATAAPAQNYLIDQIAEGPMANLAELGYIHTGYPWRTIRLRSIYPVTSSTPPFPYADAKLNAPSYSNNSGIGDPNINEETIEQTALPDWLVLDMFKIGNASTFSGRINVNTRFSGAAANLTPRLPPLVALIDNTSVNLSTSSDAPPLLLPGGTGTNVDVIAYNIANRILVSNPVSLAASPYASLPAFLTPGEICEARNLDYFSDNVGVSPYIDNPSKTRRQQLIRRISNLITTRSNTFTIWCIAQSTKKVNKAPATLGTFMPSDIVTGEVKVQAIVERYEDNSSGTPQVKFRTRYFRYLYN